MVCYEMVRFVCTPSERLTILTVVSSRTISRREMDCCKRLNHLAQPAKTVISYVFVQVTCDAPNKLDKQFLTLYSSPLVALSGNIAFFI